MKIDSFVMREPVMLAEERPQRFRIAQVPVNSGQIVEQERDKKGRVTGTRNWVQVHDERAPDLEGRPGMRIFREVILASEGHA